MGTERIIHPWITGIPKIKGQEVDALNGDTTPQTFSVNVLDIDNEITDLFAFNVVPIKTKVTARIDSTDTSITVANSAVFTLPCDLYVNKETVYATAAPDGTTLTVTRAMYGSTAIDHLLTDQNGATITLEIFNRPQFMVGRRVTLCEGIEGLAEADAMKINGFLTGTSVDESIWQFDCSGVLAILKKQICTNLPVTKLAAPLWGGETSEDQENLDAAPGPGSDGAGPVTYNAIKIESLTGGNAFKGAGTVQVGEEIIRYEVHVNLSEFLVIQSVPNIDPYTPFYLTMGRGLFSREILGDKWQRLIFDGQLGVPQFMDRHEAGEEVKQVVTHLDMTGFTSPNPIQVMLILLTSTGYGTNGIYDVLPDGWGAGIDQSMIDVAGMIALGNAYGLTQIPISVCITEPVELFEWLQENILRPCHLFLVEDLDGKIVAKTILTKDEAEIAGASITLDVGELIKAPKWAPGDMPVGEVTIKCNWNPGDDKFYTEAKCLLGDSLKRYEGLTRRTEIECKTIYMPGVGPSATVTQENKPGVPAFLNQFISPIFERWAINPCPSIEADLLYKDRYYVQPGNIVKLTMAGVPDVETGDRGVSAQLFQVVSERPDAKKGTTTIGALMIGCHDRNYRRIAPSAKIAGYDADGGVGGVPRITLEANIFSASPAKDSDFFEPLDKVILVQEDYRALDGGATPEVVTILGVGSNYIDLTAAPATAPIAGFFVDTPAYGDATTAQTEDWSFQAGSDEKIGADPGVIRQ